MNDSPPEPALLPVMPGTIRTSALAELTRLTELVNNTSIESWKEPSAVSGWSVGDVITHLDLAFGLYNRLLDAVTSGHGAGTVWRTMGKIGKTVVPASSGVLNKLNSALPKLLDRALAPEVVKGQFAAGSRGLQERLEKIGPEDYTRPVYYVGGPFPLSFFLAMMVNEMAIHGWDIESRRKPDARLSEDARAVLPWFYFSGTPFMLQPPKGTSGTVQALLSDPTAAMWWTIDGTKITQGTGTATDATATIHSPSWTFVLTLAGRIKPEEIGMTSISIEGNESLAKSFLGAWKII